MKEFKPIVIFLLKFFVTWILLIVFYNIYLNQYLPKNQADPYSITVANWTCKAMNTAGLEANYIVSSKYPITQVFTKGEYTSYINEGCNAISIMLIFVAFIIAFSTTIKQTVFYIIAGLILIQIMNVARIALINYIIYYHKEYSKIAHDYLFPAIIYGTIVILWIVWIKFFVMKKSTHEKVA